MTLSGRPLLDTRADARLFVGRQSELARLGDAVDDGLNTLLLGARGSGRSSLLRQLAYQLRQQPQRRLTVFVDAAPAGGDPDVLLSLLTSKLLDHDTAAASRSSARPSTAGSLVATIEQLRSQLPTQVSVAAGPPSTRQHALPAVVLLDGPHPAVAHSLFGRLRDELWTLPLSWVVTGDIEQRAELLRPPADAFFDLQLTVGPLSPQTAWDLLRARLPETLSAEDLERIIASSEPTPRALLATARRYLTAPGGPDPAEQQRRAELTGRLDALGRPARMLVAELRARGGAASASDPQLLDAMTWTRSRAVQVLKQLERHGLVTASPVRGDGHGRPRVVYELVEELR